MGLAVRVSGVADLSRSEMGSILSFLPARICRPEGCDQGRSAGWSHEARELSYVQASCRLPDYADEEMAVFDRALIQPADDVGSLVNAA